MERSMALYGFVVLCALLSASSAAQAEWMQNGIPFVTSSMDEGEFPPLNFGMVSDRQGGAIVLWGEYWDPNSENILAQRIDSRGNFLWTQGGVAICPTMGNRIHPYVVSDGSGGWFILWNDNRGGDFDIYAQRLDSGGHLMWAADGVAIQAAEGEQTIAGAVSNGAGSIIVLWKDSDKNTIGARLIDSNAGRLWTVEGVIGNISENCQQNPGITSDGAGGMIIAWKEFEGLSCNLSNLRILRLDSTGELRWGTLGISIAEDIMGFTFQLASDGSGGAILVWEDKTDGASGIFAQRILSNGGRCWMDGGVQVCAPQDYNGSIRLVSYGSEGTIVFWGTLLGNSDIFAQRIDMSGNLLWAAEGIAVCATANEQQTVTAVPDGSGGAIVAWTDYTPGNPWVADVCAQHITGEGVSLWPSAGLSVGSATGQQAYTRSLPDGAGGAIIAWVDSRSGKQSAYMQRIDRNGNWGYPAPLIKAVRDVPGDQGGFVNLAWLAGRLDRWPAQAVVSYSIWRAISHEQAALALKNGGAMLSNIADFAPGAAKPFVRVENAGNRTYYWMHVSTMTASHLDGYSGIVPTLFDSTAVCGEYHYFQVIAHGDDPDMYWISEPDSGRSIDNLAPAPPAGLAGTAGSGGTGLELTWNPSREADFAHYAVYRGSIEGFEPAPGNLLAVLPDTICSDGEWCAGDRCCYKVTAVDIHGNESRCSLLRPEDIAGGETPGTPAATFLAQNIPNPFNPSTKIVFGLKEPEFVSLRIYDVAGRLVRVLVEENLEAGIREAVWNGSDDRNARVASGLYFYKLKAGSFTSVKKMVLLR